MRPRASRLVVMVGMLVMMSACVSETDPGELTVYGPYVGPEASIFGEVLDAFEADSGITTSYVGTSSFDEDFDDRIRSGDLPDVSVLPQLSLTTGLVNNDLLAPLGTEATKDLNAKMGDFWGRLVTQDGAAYAVPYRFVVKSIVWYRSDVFASDGYEVPTTLAEMEALARQMIDDGHTPWCAGMDSGLSTGWWATDWVEDLVIRRGTESDYWSWALLQTPFTDDVILDAMGEFQEIVAADGAIDGGTRAILNVEVEHAIDPMFDDDPGCLMHKQASFQPIWLPDGVEFDDGTLDIFPLPGAEPGPPPMLISGEVVVATSDNPAAIEFLEYLLTDEAFSPWLEEGGSLVAGATQLAEGSANPLDRRLSQMIQDAPAVVLDASDLMPQEIGTDAFFAGMIDLIAGRTPTEVADEIQQGVDALPPESRLDT